jgi:hypothetical protein
MAAADNIFSCNETPLKFPQLMDITRLYPCISCKLRLNAQIPGTGNVRQYDTGLVLDENPQTTLSINGIQHNLLESHIFLPGAHRLPGQDEPSVAEVALYFRTDNRQNEVCLFIPVNIGAPNPYFASLDTIVRNRPTVGTLVSPTSSIISYRGADVRGRNSKDNRPRTMCDPISKIITYYVLMTPTTISAADYQRLKNLAVGSVGPAKPITEVIESRYKLLTRIDGITVINTIRPESSKDSGIATKAMKCYRLDKDKDVVNDKVYIGGHPGSTLDKELTATDATKADGEDSRDTSIQPGDIEKWIGIIIGVVLAILIVSFLIYIIWNGTFRNYMQVQKMHNSPLPKTFGEVQPFKFSRLAFMCGQTPTPPSTK